MFPNAVAGVPVDNIAHVIQVALTPVFLLSGIGTLLNVFNTRLARVSDHAEHANDLLRSDPDRADAATLRRHMERLHRRRLALDIAIALGAAAGASACGAAFALFLGALRDAGTSSVLIVLFGASLGCTVGALGAFIADTLLAWHGLRRDGTLPHTQRSG
jgi:hypothetical protein